MLVLGVIWVLIWLIISFGTQWLESFNSIYLILALLPLLLFIVQIIFKLVNRKNKKMDHLLQLASENLDLLKKDTDEKHRTKTAKWSYLLGNDFDIIEYLESTTRRAWILEDKRLENSFIKMTFGHIPDERLVIDSLSQLAHLPLKIPLTKNLVWDIKKQPMGLIVGPTGAGKTTLIKSIVIEFLANSKQNSLYTIDGKNSFLASATSNFVHTGKTATDGQTSLELLKELNRIMFDRYHKMNLDILNEKDITYVEAFPNEGHILLIADELLALISEVQASDKSKPTKERLAPQIYSRLLSLIVRGRQASISVIVSGQQMPASILPTEARDSLGLRIALGRVSQVQAQEIFNRGLSDLPHVNTSNFGGLIWLDGLDWETPKEFKSPQYDDNKLPFKHTLAYLTGQKS